MNIPRQEALLVVGLLMLAGGTAILIRLFRSRKQGLSLRMQVFLAIGLITVVLTTTFGAIVVDRFKARTVIFAHRAALDDARVAAAFTERAMASDATRQSAPSPLPADAPFLSVLASALQDTTFQILDTNGRVLFDSGSIDTANTNMATRPEVIAALSGTRDPTARLVADDRVAAAVPILRNGQIVGALRTLKSTFNLRDILADTAPKVALLALVFAGAAALAGMFIGGFMAAPIERLTRAAQRIAKGERQAALPSPKGREVKALTAAFESMRMELEQRHAVESLAADVSHELKNPVAAIRAAAEVLEDAVIHDTDAALNFAKRISQSAEKMDALIRDLLSLARLESRGIADAVKSLDITEIARAAVDDVERMATAHSVQIHLTADKVTRIKGDAGWIKRAIENLLVNAVNFAPKDSIVSVHVGEVNDGIEVVTADRGPGIDPAFLPTIFDRFITSRRAEGGTGLGLAIVRAVAEAHGGTAEVRATSEAGTTVAFTLHRVFH